MIVTSLLAEKRQARFFFFIRSSSGRVLPRSDWSIDRSIDRSIAPSDCCLHLVEIDRKDYTVVYRASLLIFGGWTWACVWQARGVGGGGG